MWEDGYDDAYHKISARSDDIDYIRGHTDALEELREKNQEDYN